jgi:hypothetical protein
MNKEDRKWIDCHFTKLQDQITKVREDIAGLKVKSGIWGLIGGAIPVIATVLIYLLTKGM